MSTLAAVIITYNEEANLADCLESLSGTVDQIIVLDSGSSDSTLAIASLFGAKASVSTDWHGFGDQKNQALSMANTDWILSIDADERLTPELAKEIRSVINDAHTCTCFSIPRRSWYCGRFIRFSGWSPDYVDRLFKNGKARFSDDLVHERLLHLGPTQRLHHPLLHYSFRNFSQVLQKLDRYSTASATQAYAMGKRASVYSAVGHGAWAFLRTFVLKRGFLDGAHGLALAISNAEGTYYKYLKIWQLGQNVN
jgi:glycosyltransferase involved in cell wall biosynthesis